MRVSEGAFKHFIDEEVTVTFHQPPLYEKAPPCPNAFNWQGQHWVITEFLSGWHSFERRGKFGSNMTAAHLRSAARRGSLNVGRYFFMVRCDMGQVFTLYYDRKAKSITDRSGRWILLGENEMEFM